MSDSSLTSKKKNDSVKGCDGYSFLFVQEIISCS